MPCLPASEGWLKMESPTLLMSRAMRLSLLTLALALAILPSLAPAQQRVSIEELERQLEAKEAEQAAAQRRAAEARRRQQEAAEAERRQQEAAEAERRQQEAAEAERRRQEQLEINGGFEEAGNGLLRDTRTGLLWTQSDNGSSVNWHQASAFCQSKGMRLPSIDELAAIYNRPGAGTTSCDGGTCKVSPLFRLTGWWYWSGTLEASSGAWYFNLYLWRPGHDPPRLRPLQQPGVVRGSFLSMVLGAFGASVLCFSFASFRFAW
jgi:hypothetical protein